MSVSVPRVLSHENYLGVNEPLGESVYVCVYVEQCRKIEEIKKWKDL